MQAVKVWNRNTFEHVEVFKEREIRIKPGQFVEMDRDDAVQFASKFYRPKFDGNGVQLPESFKKIEIEGKYGNPKPLPLESKFKCMACGHVCMSARELSVHCEDLHAEEVASDEEAEAEISKFQTEEQLAEAVKRGPGRPRKEA